MYLWPDRINIEAVTTAATEQGATMASFNKKKTGRLGGGLFQVWLIDVLRRLILASCYGD
jgi:hypothetical protein